MRNITDHFVNGDAVNSKLSITASEPVGDGGASLDYFTETIGSPTVDLEIHFQKGNPIEVGINGITNEVLLAILIDRLRGFQKGPFPCEANKSALFHAELSLFCLEQRTRERLSRGVEGTLTA